MSWLAGIDSFNSAMSLRPNLHADFQKFYALFWDKALLPKELMELCRLRVAALHGCETEAAMRTPGVDVAEDKIAALGKWPTDARFSAAEKAALQIAELFVQDPHAISDADAAAVVTALDDAALVALLELVGIFDGYCRLQLMLQLNSGIALTTDS